MNRSGLLAAIAVPLLPLSAVLGLTMMAGSAAQGPAGLVSACLGVSPGVTADPATVPRGPVAGYSGDRLQNAAAIINAGQQLGVNVRGQTIAVMTAMGESSLRVLDRGDVAGPDSRGLFQQRANGAWGSYSDRMDPASSASNFYRSLLAVPGWQTLPPTIAAHRTQHNADPYHYARYWDRAVAVVQALGGTQVTGIAPGTGNLPCTAASPASLAIDGWTKPAVGPITSNFGWRDHPVLHTERLHTGVDIGAAGGSPIYAAAAGTVVRAGPATGYGNLIVIDHGNGVTTGYGHMFNSGVLTHVGDAVTAGQQIGLVGSNGVATGNHLHFEVRLKGIAIDPVAYLRARSVPL